MASKSTIPVRQGTVVASSSAAPFGTVEITASASNAPTASVHPTPASRTPSASAAGANSASDSDRRVTTVTDVAPNCAAAASAARAVPPPPSTLIRGAAVRPASPSTRTIPGTSVLSAYQEPSGRRTSVLAAPVALATGDAAAARVSATSLIGMVTDRPAQSGPRPRTRSGNSASAHSKVLYVQPDRPAAAKPAVWMTGDSEWAMGFPQTAARRSTVTVLSFSAILELWLAQKRAHPA